MSRYNLTYGIKDVRWNKIANNFWGASVGGIRYRISMDSKGYKLQVDLVPVDDSIRLRSLKHAKGYAMELIANQATSTIDKAITTNAEYVIYLLEKTIRLLKKKDEKIISFIEGSLKKQKRNLFNGEDELNQINNKVIEQQNQSGLQHPKITN